MTRGVYVASRASLPERPAMWLELRAAGFPITSTWIDESGPGQTASMAKLWVRIADEIRRSVGVVLYVERADLPLKGALIECGIALGDGRSVAVVTPDLTRDERAKLLGSWVEHPLVWTCSTPEIGLGMMLNKRWRSAVELYLSSILGKTRVHHGCFYSRTSRAWIIVRWVRAASGIGWHQDEGFEPIRVNSEEEAKAKIAELDAGPPA